MAFSTVSFIRAHRHNMVIVKLMGGLGNQMFQYAAGRNLAHRLRTRLQLDVSLYPTQSFRTYRLHHFNIQENIISKHDLQRFVARASKVSFFERIGLKQRSMVISEKPVPTFVPAVFSAQGHVYLRGFWQSEHYFSEIAPIIRKEFTMKTEPQGINKDFLQNITETQSVALHVRRGDYVTNSTTNQFHGVCSLAYYQTAVRLITQQVREPHFFIFSDDAEWTRKNIQSDCPMTFVAHNHTEPQEDLRLMRHCKHFIIANSSFSWWGAWLSEYSDKIIIAPRQWFRDAASDTYTTMYLKPESWIQI
ncbi:MAG: alpha-1,2-fucosyltransferase [Lentisphaerae bacterium]|nr:alpha-1,2-fucosyltransferase [Lentisphaerota bacterium]